MKNACKVLSYQHPKWLVQMEGVEPPFAVPVTDKELEAPLDYIWIERLALTCQPLLF